MAKYNVEILPIAREDIAKVYHYIALDNQNAAARTTDEILDKIDTLDEFPERCPPVPDNALARQGSRMLIIKNHIAFFKVFKSDVLIYRVLHGKRDYPQLLE